MDVFRTEIINRTFCSRTDLYLRIKKASQRMTCTIAYERSSEIQTCFGKPIEQDDKWVIDYGECGKSEIAEKLYEALIAMTHLMTKPMHPSFKQPKLLISKSCVAKSHC